MEITESLLHFFEQDHWPLARILIFVLGGAFAGLMVDVRVEHVDAVRERSIAWWPIIYAGFMAIACSIAFVIWNRTTRRIFIPLFLLAFVIGGIGFYYHNGGNLEQVIKTSVSAWTDPKMNHSDGPPQIAPLAFAGLVVLGVLASLKRFNSYPEKPTCPAPRGKDVAHELSSTSDLAFLDTFTPPPLNNVTGANEVVPFIIGEDGELSPVSSGGVGAPVSPPPLPGLAQNPNANIIYAGLTAASDVAVFTFNDAGNLTLQDTVAVNGGTGPCWTLVSADGKFLYTIDTGTNSVGVFSLADPLHPKQIQEFVLGGPQNATGDPTAPRQTTDFEFALDPAGRTLYVIDHQTDAAGHFAQGNALHVLAVAQDGTLSEVKGSVQFLPSDIPAGADPQGVATIAAPKGDFPNFLDSIFGD